MRTLKFFLEFAAPDVKMKYEIIMNNSVTLLEKKDAVLESVN